MSGRLTVVFALMLVGGLLILISSTINLVIGFIIDAKKPNLSEETPFWIGIGLAVAHILVLILKVILIVLGIVGMAIGTSLIIGASRISSGEPGRVKTWSIVSIVLSILVLSVTSPLIFQGALYVGFVLGFIGSLLGLISGVLGLIWRPGVKTAQTPVQTQGTPSP